jgi:hypothetical protein
MAVHFDHCTTKYLSVYRTAVLHPLFPKENSHDEYTTSTCDGNVDKVIDWEKIDRPWYIFSSVHHEHVGSAHLRVCVCVCVCIHVLCFETHNRIIWGQAQLVVHSHSPHAGQAGNFNIISMKRGGRNRFDCTPPRYSASYLSILSEVMRKHTHTHTHTRRASKFCVSKISRRLRRRIWWAFDDRGHPPVGVRPTQFPCYIYSSSLASVYCIYTCRKKPQQHVGLRAISRNKEVFLARTVFT